MKFTAILSAFVLGALINNTQCSPSHRQKGRPELEGLQDFVRSPLIKMTGGLTPGEYVKRMAMAKRSGNMRPPTQTFQRQEPEQFQNDHQRQGQGRQGLSEDEKQYLKKRRFAGLLRQKYLSGEINGDMSSQQIWNTLYSEYNTAEANNDGGQQQEFRGPFFHQNQGNGGYNFGRRGNFEQHP